MLDTYGDIFYLSDWMRVGQQGGRQSGWQRLIDKGHCYICRRTLHTFVLDRYAPRSSCRGSSCHEHRVWLGTSISTSMISRETKGFQIH